MPNESHSVLLVEEYKLVADYLTKELVRRGMVVHVAEELTAESVIAKAEESQPDATLVDLRLTERDVPGIIDPLVAMGSGVVLVAGESDRKVLGESLVRGATGFVSKADDPQRVVEAIEDTIAGRPVLSPAVREPLIAEVLTARELESRELAAFEGLTEREHLVLWYLVLGHLAGEIARDELMSLSTVRAHLRAIFAKLGVKSQIEAVALCRQHDWPPNLWPRSH
jgi:DNA-binding NarL/FixJ family response regulator